MIIFIKIFFFNFGLFHGISVNLTIGIDGADRQSCLEAGRLTALH